MADLETHVTDQGLWAEIIHKPDQDEPRPALFLDRDGVIVEDSHYLNRIEDVRIIPGAAATIQAANTRDIPVVIVTNQAGIGYGYYDWTAFATVQAHILTTLADETGARVDAVFACPYHVKAKPPYQHPDHPWRKPNPGMVQAGIDALNVDAGASWLIGDKDIDMLAARRAGLCGGMHVRSGHGRDAGEAEKALDVAGDGFQVLGGETIADALTALPLFKD